MRYGILTGGGDVPGLNTCIKAVVRRTEERGGTVVGFRRGWAGVLNCNPDQPEEMAAHVLPLDSATVRTIDRRGGTFLHTSRTHPGQVRPEQLPGFLEGRDDLIEGPNGLDCTAHIRRVLDYLELDALITIGGDGTLSYSAHLHRCGFPVISIPKTMDNDVWGTDYCIGFSTAVTRSVDAIQSLRTSTGSHERIAVVELFGRNSGETALIASYLADADRSVIAEVPVNADRLAELVAADRARNPSNYAMVVVSEGATLEGDEGNEADDRDVFGQRISHHIGERLGSALKQRTGIAIVGQNLGYLMRSGPPDGLDNMVAKSFGTLAVQLLEAGDSGLMTSVIDGNYCTVPADRCLEGRKRVDVKALYDAENYVPRIADVHGKPMFLY